VRGKRGRRTKGDRGKVEEERRNHQKKRKKRTFRGLVKRKGLLFEKKRSSNRYKKSSFAGLPARADAAAAGEGKGATHPLKKGEIDSLLRGGNVFSATKNERRGMNSFRIQRGKP